MHRHLHPFVSLCLGLALLAWTVAGCAGRRGPSPSGPTPAGKIPPSESAAPPLPGTDRVYPSQDPRNQASETAPEAFPPAGPSDRGEAPAPGARSGEGPAPGLAPGPDAVAPGCLSVQVLASSSRDLATERAEDLAPHLPGPVRVLEEGGLFKVRFGRFVSQSEAEEARREANRLGLWDAFIAPCEAGGR